MADVKLFAETGGKLLTLSSDGRTYGFIINDVTDIIEIPEIVPVPTVPEWCPGLINLRGKAVPVFDLRLKLGSEKGEYDERSCLIVLEVNTHQCALRVDRVIDVLDITPDKIALSPAADGVVCCFVTDGEERIYVLDPEKLVRR